MGSQLQPYPPHWSAIVVGEGGRGSGPTAGSIVVSLSPDRRQHHPNCSSDHQKYLQKRPVSPALGVKVTEASNHWTQQVDEMRWIHGVWAWRALSSLTRNVFFCGVCAQEWLIRAVLRTAGGTDYRRGSPAGSSSLGPQKRRQGLEVCHMWWQHKRGKDMSPKAPTLRMHVQRALSHLVCGVLTTDPERQLQWSLSQRKKLVHNPQKKDPCSPQSLCLSQASGPLDPEQPLALQEWMGV